MTNRLVGGGKMKTKLEKGEKGKKQLPIATRSKKQPGKASSEGWATSAKLVHDVNRLRMCNMGGIGWSSDSFELFGKMGGIKKKN